LIISNSISGSVGAVINLNSLNDVVNLKELNKISTRRYPPKYQNFCDVCYRLRWTIFDNPKKKARKKPSV